jgi:hypothetical protein
LRQALVAAVQLLELQLDESQINVDVMRRRADANERHTSNSSVGGYQHRQPLADGVHSVDQQAIL